MDLSFVDDFAISTNLRPTFTAMFKESDKVLRPQTLRGSSLPICAITTLHKMLVPQPENFDALFYTEIGTAVHTALQKWHVRTVAAFGDWSCTCGKKFSLCLQPECCGFRHACALDTVCP